MLEGRGSHSYSITGGTETSRPRQFLVMSLNLGGTTVMMVIWGNLLKKHIVFLDTRYLLREDEQAREPSSVTVLLECFRKQTLLAAHPLAFSSPPELPTLSSHPLVCP